MKICRKNRPSMNSLPGAVIAMFGVAALVSALWAADPADNNPPAKSAAAEAKADTNAPPATPVAHASQREKRKLSGAELYSIHCNRCHPERYPTERTAAQWKTIMLHMRVRANLPGEQARTILKYLQDNSGR